VADRSGNLNAFTAANGDRFTGNWQLNNGQAMTCDAGATVTTTGYYTGTIEGQIVCNLTMDNPFRLRSSQTKPTSGDWAGLSCNGVDANSTLKGAIIEDCDFGIYFNSTYAADNLDLDKVKFNNCAFAIGVNSGAVSGIDFGDIEIAGGGTSATAFTECIRMAASGTWTLGRVWIHDRSHNNSASTDPVIDMQAGTLTIAALIIQRVASHSRYIYRTTGTPTLNLTKVWIDNPSNSTAIDDAIFYNWTSGTLNVDGGIVRSFSALVDDCVTNALVTFDNVDFYGLGRYSFIEGGNFTHCYFDGITYSTNPVRRGGSISSIANTGTADGSTEYNPGGSTGFYSVDSINDTQATPNYPPSISSDLNVSSVTANGAAFAWTVGCPGRTVVMIDDAARTVNGWFDSAEYVGVGWESYTEWIDYSGKGKTIDTLTSRTRTIANHLKDNTAFKGRLKFIPFWEDPTDAVHGSEQSFTTLASSTTPTFSGIVSLTDMGDGTLLATWTGATDGVKFEVHLHTSSMNDTNLDARTYVVGCVDDNGGSSYSYRIAVTAQGAAKLTKNTTYYCAVRAIGAGGLDDGNTVNASKKVTNPVDLGSVDVVIPQGAPVSLQTTATAIYTCPSGKVASVKLSCANVDSSSRPLTLHLVLSGGSEAATNKLVNAVVLSANADPNKYGPFVLNAGDKISGLTDSNDKVVATPTPVEVTL
jgi:hypothetical protein